MSAKTKILIYTSMPWSHSNRKEFTLELGRQLQDAEIVVIDRPSAIFPNIFRPSKWWQFRRNDRIIKEIHGVTVIRPNTFFHDQITSISTTPLGAFLNNLLIKRCLRKHTTILEGTGKHILWLYEQISWPISTIADWDEIVWEIFDDYTLHSDGTAREKWAKQEHQMIRISTVCFTLTSKLKEKYCNLTKNVHVIGNGFDEFQMSNARPPKELPSYLSSNKIRVGFVGRVRSWIDFGLLESIMIDNPNYDFIFIGPVDNDVISELKNLRRHSNFHYFGPVSKSEGYWHMKNMNIGFVPYVRSSFTAAVKPIKMVEFLAAGIPVVTTLDADIEAYKPFVRTVTSPKDFKRSVIYFEQQSNNSERCKKLVKNDRWSEKVEFVKRTLRLNQQN